MKRGGFALGLGASALVALCTHASSLVAPFFADDWLFLDQVRTRSFLGALTSPDPLGNYFRPLSRQVWFWLLAHLSGNSPFVFHAANLACLVLAVVLLGVLARRVAGPYAGVVASAFLAMHYAADVPVLWVSGCQELLSLTLALAALVLYTGGRRAAAAITLLLALLAKEVVVLVPLVAIALDSSGGAWRARVRRAWPLGTAVAVWLALAVWAMAERGAPGASLSLTALGPLAAPLLLIRVVLGLEWPTGRWLFTRLVDPGGAVVVALVIAAAAVWFAAPYARRTGPRRTAASTRQGKRAPGPAPVPVPSRAETEPEPMIAYGGVQAGILWALAGALPVAAVAPGWSAYYFLFAVAGAGLALGAYAARARWSGWVTALVLAVLGFASAQARALEEFATAPSPWSAQSHVNRFYLERGMRVVARGLADLQRQVPRPEPRTTFFFAGLPSFAGFQTADGPLLRVTYADTTLRGYYLSQMSLDRLERGPVRMFFYDLRKGSVVEHTQDHGVFMSSAVGQMLDGHYDVAEAALVAAHAHGEDDLGRAYVAGVVALAQGDRVRALEHFAESRHFARGGGEVAERAARVRLAAGDSLAALAALREGLRTDVLHVGLHALAADLILSSSPTGSEGMLHALMTVLLAPEQPGPWRRWGYALARENRQPDALAAFDRYFALLPAAIPPDSEAVRVRALLKRMLPGGDLTQRAMRRELVR
jgi:hypothetical protein